MTDRASQAAPTLSPRRLKRSTHTKTTLRRARLATKALNDTLDRWGCWVQGWEIMETWEDNGGDSRAFSKGLPHALRPAIEDGTVRDLRIGTFHLFVTAGRSELPLPKFFTDQQRTIAVVSRACALHRSAVPMEKIISVYEASPDLTLHGRSRLSALVGRCARDRMLVRRTRHRRKGKVRWYYALPGGHTSVSAAVTTAIDQRLAAFEDAWTWSGGLPMTTATIRRFCDSRQITFEDDSTWAWAAALYNLEACGDIVRIPLEDDGRDVVWALAADWLTLLPDRQEALRRAVRERLWDPEEDSDAPLTFGMDPGWVSRNEDCRRLVDATRQLLAAKEKTPEAARLVALRPLSLSELREGLAELGGRVGALSAENLVVAMRESARLRKGMVNCRVIYAGVVSGTSFYDTTESPEGETYLEYLRLIGTDLAPLRRQVAGFGEAVRHDRSGEILVGERILDARAHLISHTARDLLRGGRRIPRHHLTEEEGAELSAFLASVSEVLRSLPTRGVKSSRARHRGKAESEPQGISYSLAAAEVAEAGGGELYRNSMRPLALPPADLAHATPSGRSGAENDRSTRGRPISAWYDAVFYRLYALRKWAGPRLASLARQAAWTMGELRDPAPLIATLAEDPIEAHAGAAAALGVIADSTSRKALVQYLNRAFGSAAATCNTTVPALEVAVLGLCKPPFGGGSVALAVEEEAALQMVQEADRADDRLKAVAARVLRSRREDWSIRRRLHL